MKRKQDVHELTAGPENCHLCALSLMGMEINVLWDVACRV